jgi:DNA helicase-2/ATP-dependent DNA helicase PcrA
MLNYQAELNAEQHEIVTQADGHCLVLAGAGSGKTRTLTYRVAYLLEHGVKPEQILLMTFTNKAANEMIERVRDLLGYTPYALWAGTFHRIGNQVLRRYAHLLGYSPQFVILDQNDTKQLMKDCYKELAIDTKSSGLPKPEVVRSMLSYARNTSRTIDDWLCVKYNFPSFILDQIIDIHKTYQRRKRELNAMDFDDLLELWRNLLRDFPEVKQEMASKFKYILVDEYQDTNNIQAQIIKDLASVHHNVLAVGDDSQSIYSFRAADIGHILNFDKDFADTKLFKLVTNYRSTPEILDLANQSIAYNTKQYYKELKSVKESGTLPVVMAARNVYQQADFVIDRIKELRKERHSLAEVAVLFRAGHASAELQLQLSKHNIPFVVRSGQKYFDQAHIKDILAFLRVWLNIHDELAWMRVMNLLPGIGPKTAQKIFAQIQESATLAELLQRPLKLSKKQFESWLTVKKILQHFADVSESAEHTIVDAIRFVMLTFYKDYLKNTYDNADSRIEDLQAFLDFADSYEDLEKLLTDVTLDEQATNQAPTESEQDKLVLSTIHQAKGLEWDEVMVIGVREGSFPHFRSRESQSELEEERRLFYVAVTRARKKLTLLYPIKVHSYEYGEMMSDPSLFIQELDEDAYVKLPKRSHDLLGNYGFNDNDAIDWGNRDSQNVRYKPGDNFFGEDYSDAARKMQSQVVPEDEFYEEPTISYDD